MQSRPLMEWVLRIMANLLRPDELGPAEAAYKMVAAMVAVVPEPELTHTTVPASTLRHSAATLTHVRQRQVAAAADGWEDGDFVVVVQLGGVAVEGLVAVDPDARGVEHGGELLAVRRAAGASSSSPRVAAS